MSGVIRGHVLIQLVMVFRTLQYLIVSFTDRKSKVDVLIRLMKLKAFEAFISQDEGRMLRRMCSMTWRKTQVKKMLKLVTMEMSMNISLLVTPSNGVVCC